MVSLGANDAQAELCLVAVCVEINDQRVAISHDSTK